MDDVRKMELMAMSESQAENLSLSDRHERIRLLREKIGMEAVKLHRSISRGTE